MNTFDAYLIAFIALSSFTHRCNAFLETRIVRTCSRLSYTFPRPLLYTALELSAQSDSIDEEDVLGFNIQLDDKVRSLCREGKLSDATKLLEKAELKFSERGDDNRPEEKCYLTIFKAFTEISKPQSAKMADDFLKRMITNSENGIGCLPTAQSYNAAISVWASSNRAEAGEQCSKYLDSLWSIYNETNDPKYLPLRSSYITTIDALSQSRGGFNAGKKAEALLENMEDMQFEHPQLTPTTICYNAVMNVWSKSGVARGAASRCEEIVNRMLSFYDSGRDEIMPDTTSFNTAIHTLAKSREMNSESRAEALLELMNEISSEDTALGASCKPDEVSFNTVLDCWAQSRLRGGARRATSILQHMEQRYAAGLSNVHPDATSYTTVINAWARSRDKDAVAQAEEVLRWSEEAHRSGIADAKPNALSYNSLINCFSKSYHSSASSRAVAVLNQMKEMSLEDGCDDCRPDVVTYTSVIDTLAKQSSYKASEDALHLLEELESAYEEASDPLLKPNIRTYTSVINAIARSRTNPQRAEAILNKTQASYETGQRDLKPDVVSYNALINAYGWSDEKNKAAKCLEILKRMIDLHSSGMNFQARPDIITCNSVLNACAFSDTSSDSERAELMDIAIETFELFQSAAPKFGYPDHGTYAMVLLAISRHMPLDSRRMEMAETTFWQCCEKGHVNALVVTNLRLALSWERFADVMGPCLKSSDGEKLRYDLHKLPKEWTRYSPPSNRKKSFSRPSKKRDRRFQITKQSVKGTSGAVKK